MDVCGVDAKRYPITLPHVIAETLRTPLRTPFTQTNHMLLLALRYTVPLCSYAVPLRRYDMLLRYAVTFRLSRVQRPYVTSYDDVNIRRYFEY